MMDRFKQMGVGLLIITIILGSSIGISWLLRVFPWIFVASLVASSSYLIGGLWQNRRRHL